MFNNIYTYCFFILLLASCATDTKKTIDLSEIIPTSEKEYSSTDSSTLVDSQSNHVAYFNQFDFQFEKAIPKVEKLFPERFGPDSTSNIELIKGDDTLYYHKWVFSDSIKVMNAFYNWIDCFGKNCKSLFIGQESNFQVNALQIIVSDTALIFIEGKRLNFEDWYRFHDELGYKNNWSYCIEQPFRGKAKWFVLEGNKKTKYVKK